jgi:hypothetical protein
MFVCALISDVLIFEMSHSDFISGTLFGLANTKNNNCVAIEPHATTFEHTFTTASDVANYIRSNSNALYRKVFKIQKRWGVQRVGLAIRVYMK